MKPRTIWIMLSIGVTHGWSIYQLNVYNAFLNKFLDTNMFMTWPISFFYP